MREGGGDERRDVLRRGVPFVLAGLVVTGVLVVGYFTLTASTKSYRVPSESMVPTLDVGDRFTANRDAFDGSDAPQRGDIVVLHPPQAAIDEAGAVCGAPVEEEQLCPRPADGRAEVGFVARAVAVGGDRLAVRRGRAIVGG